MTYNVFSGTLNPAQSVVTCPGLVLFTRCSELLVENGKLFLPHLSLSPLLGDI